MSDRRYLKLSKLIIGKYKSTFDFPKQNQIINEIFDIIRGKTKSPIGVFGQTEELALKKVNNEDDFNSV